MKLYANGCSFTHGHKDHVIVQSASGDVKEDIKKDAPWVWPRCLDPYFDEVVNEAWGGGSNARIFRRSLEFLSQVQDPANWIVVLQFTDLDRSEWYDSESNTWVGQLNHRIIYDDRSWNKDGINRTYNEKKGMHNITNRAMVNSGLQTLQDFLLKLIAFQSFCDSRGFKKVIYTSMSGVCDLNEIVAGANGKENDFGQMLIGTSKCDKQLINSLLKEVRTENAIFSIARIAKYHVESEDDAHPNARGHKLFSDYILRQMRERGFL